VAMKYFKNILLTLFIIGFLLISNRSIASTLYFFSGFETKDVSAWIKDGGGNHTGDGFITNEKAHSKRYSWKAYNSLQRNDAKLLRWRFDYSGAYYSAWFFWPIDYMVSGTKDAYVNMFQWKERVAPYDPTWIIAVKNSYTYPGKDEIVVHDYHGAKIYRNNILLPKGIWFHIEAFIKCSQNNGQLLVWLNGKKIFNISNINTLGNPQNKSYLMWGVGNYGDSGLGKYIYVDDAAVSDFRVFNQQMLLNRLIKMQNLK
jgi:hypothetical protein